MQIISARCCLLRQITAILVLSGSLTIGAFAQSESGNSAVQGVVLDPSGAAVRAASVTLRHSKTGYTRTVTTDAGGEFRAPVLPVGDYRIEAVTPGFSKASLDNVQATVGTTAQVELRLALAADAQEITVVDSAEPLDVRDAGTASVLPNRFVSELPIRGRNFTEFIQLTPAVMQESDRSGLVISGQRSINSNVAIDGADFNDPVQGNQRGGNETVFYFPQSAVLEFQVVRAGAGAEVGRTNAGFVNVVTRSGSNAWHGDAFYRNRNRHLTSPDAFGRSLDNRQNQFGGSFNGPLLRDRAFFFVAAEQNLLRVPFVVQFQPQAAGVAVPPELLALQGETHGTNNPTAVFARSDFHLSPLHSLNLQYMNARIRGENFNFDSPQIEDATSTNYSRQGGAHGVKGSLVSVLTPAPIHELRSQFATDVNDEVSNSALPQIQIRGFGRIGGDADRPRSYASHRYQGTDNLTTKAGVNQLRFGGDVNITDVSQTREGNLQGKYEFRSLADYLARRIDRYRQTVSAIDADALHFRGYQKEFALYAQDEIQLHRDLTVTAGLRWEGQWNPQPVRPNPAVAQTSHIPNDLGQWQPRLGVAWNPARSRTVLRLSAGILTARTPATLFQRVFTNNGFTTVAVDSRIDPVVLAAVVFPEALTAAPAGLRTAAPRVFGFDPKFRNPRSFQTSATVERAVGSTLALSAGYLRNSTWNLQRRLDRNLFPPFIDAAGMPIFPRVRPNPAIGILSINESSAHSSYDALVLSLTRRFSGRFQAQAHYTFAQNIDDDSNERNFSRESALNPFDLRSERAWSKQDIRHNLNVSGLFSLPGSVTFSSILLTRSGLPYTPIIGSDTQNDGNDDNDRAIINGQVAGRNSLRQPSLFALDMRVAKAFHASDQGRIECTFEAFNVTRAANMHFGSDGVSLFGTTSAPVVTAGQPLYAPSTARFGGPRQVQLGVRYAW